MAKSNPKKTTSKMTKPWRNDWKRPQFSELTVRFPVFSNFRVSIYVSDKLDETARYIADRDYVQDHEEVAEGAEAFVVGSTRGGYALMYLRPGASAGTIAHEAYHAVRILWKMSGVSEENEATAYHLGYLVTLVTDFQKEVTPRFQKQKRGK